ncbi:amidohydrolase family protein [Paraferrimonas sp. SM1919]|uniref:metal-dependent hydrolase family protein n=1 Tax=Paraferrimonas sp. SM1919 TaxID=2662263 RepID=UPI0013D12891|nr:amidohydrolase family protein [Paraferrimonas sp. SM1919]
MLKKLSLLALLVSAYSASAATLIHSGKLIDGVNDKVLTKQTIVVEGNKITAIKSGYITPSSSDTLIDLKDATLLPGFIDMHTHLVMQTSKNNYLENYRLEPADVALRGALYAKRTLEAGFTSVRDLGDKGNASISLRNAINGGYVIGPRIFTAGKSIATTGGHADPSNGHRKGLWDQPTPADGVINGAVEATKAVRERYQDGADLIKITATGGVLSMAKSGQNPQFQMHELEAIVNTAKDYGMTVAVHAHGREGMRRAIMAGVTTIEHGTYMDNEIMALMKKHNVTYVPTLLAGAFVAQQAAIPGYYPEIVRPKAAKIGPLIKETFARAVKAGVTIAYGTDAGVFYHGDNAKEFAIMVDAGMDEMAAIKSATSVAARTLNQDNIGQLKAGYLADIVAVKGNPLDDIRVLESIDFVMKDGKQYK